LHRPRAAIRWRGACSCRASLRRGCRLDLGCGILAQEDRARLGADEGEFAVALAGFPHRADRLLDLTRLEGRALRRAGIIAV